MSNLKKSTIYFPDRAPVKTSVEVQLKATPTEVWNVLTDSPNWVNWFDGTTSCETTLEKDGGIGSTRRISVSGLVAEEEFIGWEPNKLWCFTVYNMKPFPICRRLVERVILDPILDENDGTKIVGTRVTYAVGFEPSWIIWLFQSILLYSMSSSWKKSLPNIDTYLSKLKQTKVAQ